MVLKGSRKAGEMMDQNPDVQEDLGTGGKFKNWLQDNIRIILSVLIVLAIAGGIYSYSNRADRVSEDEFAMQSQQEEQMQSEKKKDDAVTIIGEEEKKEQQKNQAENKVENKPEQAKPSEMQTQPEPQAEPQKPSAPQTQQSETPKTPEKSDDVKVNGDGQSTTSQETSEAFVETAARGDSKTTLARMALRDYLEKNNDSSLTAEHKVYIEDYLQKRLQHSKGVKVGEQISFSKTMIKDAVEKSKTLNDSQLKNLQKYSSRVSNI